MVVHAAFKEDGVSSHHSHIEPRWMRNAFIVAHTLDADTGEIELTFGRPWLNLRGGPAWHWRENLLTVALPAVRRTDVPAAAEIDKLSAVPDAQVRLRVIDGGRRAGRGRDGGQA